MSNRGLHMRDVLSKAKNWGDFKAKIERLPPKQRGDCFETLTKYYLQLDPKYQTKLKTVWFLKDVPAKVRKRLNLPDADEGIDLVAQTKDGEFWAIQCKYRSDERRTLSRRELSTFTDLCLWGLQKHLPGAYLHDGGATQPQVTAPRRPT